MTVLKTDDQKELRELAEKSRAINILDIEEKINEAQLNVTRAIQALESLRGKDLGAGFESSRIGSAISALQASRDAISEI